MEDRGPTLTTPDFPQHALLKSLGLHVVANTLTRLMLLMAALAI